MPILKIKNAICGLVSSSGQVVVNPSIGGEQHRRPRRWHRRKHRRQQKHQSRLGWWLGQVAIVVVSIRSVIEEARRSTYGDDTGRSDNWDNWAGWVASWGSVTRGHWVGSSWDDGSWGWATLIDGNSPVKSISIEILA